MSSTNRRPAGARRASRRAARGGASEGLRSSALGRAAGIAALLLGTALPASAQEASGGLSATIPTLRGSVDGSAGGAAAVGTPDAGTDAPSAAAPPLPDGSTPTAPQPPRNRFAPPKGDAKTADRVRVPRKGPPVLPALQAYPSSQRLRGSGATIDTVSPPTGPAPSVAALPLPTRLRGRPDDAPYEPVGFEVGSLRLTPSITQSFGYDDNPEQVQTKLRGSVFERTEGEVGLVSTWSRNELRADLRGGYNDYFSTPEANRPDASGTIDYRYDVDRDALIDAQMRFALDTQRVGSPEVSSQARSRPLISTFGGSLGGSETFGRTTLALHGSLDRTAYDNPEGGDGTLQDLASQNFNDAGLRLRATYELTPVLRPFVDVLADDRLHDRETDYTGYRRDSVGVTGQVGSSFELTRLLSGELSAGYGGRSYDDKRLKDITSPVFNGVVTYAATPLTTISFRAATSFDESTVAGASGTESRSATLDISHAFLRNLTVTGSLSYLDTKYVGVPITEDTWAETLKAEYHLSRSLVASASYNHQNLSSTSAGSSFSENVFLMGLRWQR